MVKYEIRTFWSQNMKQVDYLADIAVVHWRRILNLTFRSMVWGAG